MFNLVCSSNGSSLFCYSLQVITNNSSVKQRHWNNCHGMLKERPVLGSSPATGFSKTKLAFHGQGNAMVHTGYF